MESKIKIYKNIDFDDSNIKYAFTSRQGGYSNPPFNSFNLATHVGDDPDMVNKNRELLAQEVNFEKDKITWASQVHGDKIFVLKDKKDIGFVGEYDGIITNLTEIPILTFYADCIPILIHDPVKNVVASIHAGWKGTFIKIVGKAITIMLDEFASKVEDIKVLIGPGICKEHYLVSKELILDFKNKFPEVVNEESLNLDLKEINKLILKNKGIEKIFDIKICTSCDNQNFFSFREEKGLTGRFAALIMLK